MDNISNDEQYIYVYLVFSADTNAGMLAISARLTSSVGAYI